MANIMKKPVIRFKGFTDAWEQRKLGELGEVITGSTPSTSHEEYYSADGIPWVTPTDITENVIYDTPRKLSEEGQKVGRVVPKNTILVTCIASIGKNAILGTTGSFNQQINGLVPNFNMYVPYFLFTESIFWSEKMKRQAAAGTMQIVNKTEFSELETSVPNYKEQEKVGAFFSNLDTLITLHQRKYDKLVNVKKSMLEKMFPKNGSDVPEIRFKGFTDAWEQRKFGDLGSVAMCKRIFKEQTTATGEIPFYKIGTFGGEPDAFISRELFEEYKAKFSYPEVGDMLISASGTIGRTVEYTGKDEYFQDSNIVWFKHDDRIDNSFLRCLYSIVEWLGIEGSTIKRLYNDNFLKTEFMLPCVAEQSKVGSFFSRLDNLITLHQRKLEKLKNIKKSMLEKMFG